MGRALPTADVSYAAAQLEGRLSGGEIVHPTGAGRPKPARRISPMLPDAQPRLLAFRICEAVVPGPAALIDIPRGRWVRSSVKLTRTELGENCMNRLK